MKNDAKSCACTHCVGAACTCGCQAPRQMSACQCGCQQGDACRCGERDVAPSSPVRF